MITLKVAPDDTTLALSEDEFEMLLRGLKLIKTLNLQDGDIHTLSARNIGKVKIELAGGDIFLTVE